MELTEMQKKVIDYSGGRLFVNGSRRSGKTSAIYYLFEKWINGNSKCFYEKETYNILVMCHYSVIEDVISSIRINKWVGYIFNKPERMLCFNCGNKKINIEFCKEFVPNIYDIVIIDDLYYVISGKCYKGKDIFDFLFNNKSNYIVFGTPSIGNIMSRILYYAFYHYAKENKFLINTDFLNGITTEDDYNQLKMSIDNNMFETQINHNIEAMF